MSAPPSLPGLSPAPSEFPPELPHPATPMRVMRSDSHRHGFTMVTLSPDFAAETTEASRPLLD